MDKITLAAARTNAGLTLEEAAAELGKRPSTLSAWENFICEPRVSDAQKLARIYGRDLEKIAWVKEDK